MTIARLNEGKLSLVHRGKHAFLNMGGQLSLVLLFAIAYSLRTMRHNQQPLL